jgi:hypothetical protein
MLGAIDDTLSEVADGVGVPPGPPAVQALRTTIAKSHVGLI